MSEKATNPEPGAGSAGKGKGRLKLVLFILIIILVAVSVKVFHLEQYFSTQRIGALLEGMGIWAPVVFILLYGVGMLVGLPGTLFTVAGGLIFGTWFGTLYNVIGASLGASGAFWIARLLGSEALVNKFSGQKWFEKLNAGLEENGLYYMLFIRLVPLFPFNGVNFGSGLTKMSFRDYFIGTAVGIIPGAFVYTNAAAELGESAKTGQFLTGGTIGAFVLLGLFALIPIVIKKRLESKKPTGEEA
ncbi:MAG: TVP38/TMEM64 family protein [Nitrospinota bacterium]